MPPRHYSHQRDEAIANRDRAFDAEQHRRDYQRQLEFHLSVLPDPGMLIAYRGKVGRTFRFRVVGAGSGAVWGSDVYTADSWLATAAIHAGALLPGEQGVVEVTMLPGQQQYVGSNRNGVFSGSWQAYSGSFRIAPLTREGRPLFPPAVVPRPYPSRAPLGWIDGRYPEGTLLGYRGQRGEVISLDVTGSEVAAAAMIWGTDVYSDDSPVATVAVHAGILRPGQKGRVRITILDGRLSYEGSTRNGVTSQPYGPWGGSYRIEAERP